jgi:hypothetical protein
MPWVAKSAHKKMKVGMSVNEVVDILLKYRHHSSQLRIKLCEDDCKERNYGPDEFIKIVNQVANKEISYVNYEAKIYVLFMGPAFNHNDFRIYFNSEGRVETITELRHWD